MTAEIDVGAVIDQMERVLESGEDPARCRLNLAILDRWQRDQDLSQPSRMRAAEVVKKFWNRYQG